jgi:hypothetical protein
MSHQLILKCPCGKVVSTMTMHPNEGQPDVDEERIEGKCATCKARNKPDQKFNFGSGSWRQKKLSRLETESFNYHGKRDTMEKYENESNQNGH